MKTRSIMLLILAFLVGATLPMASAATTTNMYQNFDTNMVGDMPSGWGQGGSQGYAVVTNNPFVSSPNSLVLVNTNGGQAAYALRSPSPTINSNFDQQVQVKYSIYLAQTEATYNLRIDDFGTVSLFRLAFDNAGHITAFTNGGSRTVANWNTGLWYHVTLDFIPSNKIYSVSVSTNGGLFASMGGLTFENNNRNFEYVYLQTYGAFGKDTYGYFDDISVIINPIPEPTLGGLVALGVGLLLWHRRRSA